MLGCMCERLCVGNVLESDEGGDMVMSDWCAEFPVDTLYQIHITTHTHSIMHAHEFVAIWNINYGYCHVYQHACC